MTVVVQVEEDITDTTTNGKKCVNLRQACGGTTAPGKGKISFRHAPPYSDWDARKTLVLRTLAGDEFRRPLVAESFNTGEADQNGAALLAYSATWKKAQEGKELLVNRLMKGTVGSLLKGADGDKNQQKILADGKLPKHPPREFNDDDEAAVYIQVGCAPRFSLSHPGRQQSPL